MRRLTDFLSVEGLGKQALANGGTASPTGFRWNIASQCLDPVQVEHAGVGQVSDGGLINARYHRIFGDVIVRCRQCQNCLRYRAWSWRTRAITELGEAHRSWFGTLTLRPDEHYRVQCQAAMRVPGFHAMDPCGQFAARHVVVSQEITKFLKRVRKQSGAPMRYLLVAERHKSGLPHYHVLLHEQDKDRPVRHAVLSNQWHLGFANFKLVDEGPKAAAYAAKYLSKDASARVRASVRYGRRPETISIVEAALLSAPRASRPLLSSPMKKD